MLRDPPATGPRVGQHEQTADRSRAPPEPLLDDLCRKPRLLVVPAKGVLHGCQLGLDFDDEEDAVLGMPRDQIDRAALAVDGEGQLGQRVPPEGLEEAGDRLHQSGMPLVEQTVEVSALPSDGHHEIGLEESRHAVQGADRHPLDEPALRRRDLRLRDAERVGYVLLSKPLADSKRPK